MEEHIYAGTKSEKIDEIQAPSLKAIGTLVALPFCIKVFELPNCPPQLTHEYACNYAHLNICTPYNYVNSSQMDSSDEYDVHHIGRHEVLVSSG